MRPGLLAAIVLSIAMMAGRVSYFRSLLDFPGGARLLFETAVALILHGAITLWATRPNFPDFQLVGQDECNSHNQSAVVTMTIVVAVGFLIEFYLATSKPEYVATWGEFKRSGWSDVRAFTTANTLESALTHLMVGPVVGAALGWGAGS